jgi:NifU-like protein involved in Fe-S cluster formation
MDFDRYKKMNDEKENSREIPGADVDFMFENGACGDGYRVFLKIKDGVIEDASYITNGCGFGLVSLAVMTKLAKGMTLAQAQAMTGEDIQKDFDFPPMRKHYTELAAEVLRLAVESYKEKEKAV